ncbi:MAG: AMP-binding protein [Oligoflexia bacterium]|nr:AMP-binding protein [Oligoflexia bacterium]
MPALSTLPTASELAQWGAPADLSARLAALLPATAQQAPAAWRRISMELLRPQYSFALHQRALALCYGDWDASVRGPAPAWIPDDSQVAGTNLASLGRGLDMAAIHAWSVAPDGSFWQAMLGCLGIVARVPASTALDLSDGAERARWFPGMRLNIVESCFVGRDPDDLVLVGESEQGRATRWTRRQLQGRVAAVAAALRARGIVPGDAVAIDMPMTPWSVAIYLGIVAVGAAVVSIADSFAPDQIRTRLTISKAKAIFTQDIIPRGGRKLPLYQRVLDADAPWAVVCAAGPDLQVELRPQDLSFEHFLAAAGAVHLDAPVVVHVADAEAVSNILFSSGTTGDPKAIPWTHLTPIKAAGDGFVHHDIRPQDIVAWPTNLGWMMGPWLIYASLLNGAAIALYEGDPSSAGFCRFVQDTGVTMLGVVPSLVRAWRARGAVDGLDWSTIRCFSSTGEASRVDDMLWLMSRAGYRPVIEYCGGTEIGGGYITGSLLQPQAPATFSTPAVGTDLVLIDDSGALAADEGELALLPPMLGSSNRLLKRDHHQVYFAGMPPGPEGQPLRRHGDRMARMPGGFYRAMGRVDDTMNLGGIKVSSAEIERACLAKGGAEELAAVAIPQPGGGPDALVLFVVPSHGSAATADELAHAFQGRIRAHLNPLFKVSAVHLRDALPRTASGKIMRRVLRGELLKSRPA